MASLINIYNSSATNNQSGFSGAPLYNGGFNNGLDGQQVNGVGGSGLGLTNSTSNPFKPKTQHTKIHQQDRQFHLLELALIVLVLLLHHQTQEITKVIINTL
jgi:hypothetical protein